MLESLATVAVLAPALLYACGLRRLWALTGEGGVVHPIQALAFAGALLVLLVALVPPLDAAVDDDLALHMVQHVLLLAVVPPLLAASAPLTAMLYALPTRWRRRVQPAWRQLLRSQERRFWPMWTAASLALTSLTLGVWHIPALYDAAVTHDGIHALEHLSFVATATLFWWMVLGAGRRARRGLGVLAVFLAMLPGTALGVLMTLSSTPWYSSYGRGAHAVEDQQIAGAVMWGFGGLALVVAGAVVFATWLMAMDRADARARERVAARPW